MYRDVKGESEIGQNPINADKENDIIDFQNAYGTDFKEVDFNRKVYRLGGKSLSEFGVADMNHIRKVYSPYKGGSLLYYYLVMEKENAERYFVQYYDFHANREEIDTYFNRYLSGGFQLGDFADPKNQYTILGNSLVSSALSTSGVTLLTGVDQTTLNPAAWVEQEGAGLRIRAATRQIPRLLTRTLTRRPSINAEEVVNDRNSSDARVYAKQIEKEYKGLNYNLKEEAPPALADPDVDPVEAAKHYVFNSVIKEAEVEQYLTDNHVGEVTYTTTSGLQAHLAKGDVSLSGITYVDWTKLRLLVCFGDVTVDKDFSGLIVAKGKITVTGANNIKLAATDLANVLEAESEISGDTRTPIDMFVNGGGSMLNGAHTWRGRRG